jgi:hypothetical protein
VPTTEFDGQGTSHVVIWAGAILHSPHAAVLQQSSKIPSRIYVAGRSKGSPAYQYGLDPTIWIIGVNGIPVQTLTEFLEAVRKVKEGEYVRIKTINFDMVTVVLSVKSCLFYYPTVELIKDPSEAIGWRKHVY